MSIKHALSATLLHSGMHAGNVLTALQVSVSALCANDSCSLCMLCQRHLRRLAKGASAHLCSMQQSVCRQCLHWVEYLQVVKKQAPTVNGVHMQRGSPSADAYGDLRQAKALQGLSR